MPAVARLFEQIDGRGLPGKQQDLASRNRFGHGDCQFDTSHFGHHDIRDKKVRVDSASKLQGTLPVVGGHCGEAAPRKDNRQGICYDSLVVHNENNGLIFFGHGIFTEPQVEGTKTIAAIF